MSEPLRAPLVLLQTSDWHVGSPLTGRGLALPPELREKRRIDVDGAAERAVTAAWEVNADGLLVPGDLWDAESAPPNAIHRMLEAFAAFAPQPVFVAPGNHDYCGPASWYDPALLLALGMRPWPENVVVFRQTEWSATRFPGRGDVTVVGRMCPSSGVVAERPLSTRPPSPTTPISLLLLHGSLESYRGPDRPEGEKRTAPFSADELLGCGYTWAALGHHHGAHVLRDDSGVPRAAYSGCPTGRGLDEAGPRAFLKVTIAAPDDVTVEEIPADPTTIFDLSLDVSDASTSVVGGSVQTVLERAAALLESQGVTPKDVVCLTLKGTQPFGSRPAAGLSPLSARALHLVVRDRTAPPVSAEAQSTRTAEGRFVAGLLARREKATDAWSRRVIDLALALGRDALAGRSLSPPDHEETP